MDYDQMRALEKSHVCAMCGSELVTIWDKENSVNRLCCGKDHTHNGFQQRLTTSQIIKRGELDKVHGVGAQKDLEERAKRSEIALRILPKEDLGDFHALTLQEVDGIIDWAKMVGLNAYLGHVDLFYGKPRPSVDGYYYLAKKRDRRISVLALPATAKEYEHYKVPKVDYFYIAHGWEDGKEINEVGLGILRVADLTELSKKNPDQLRHPVAAKYPERTAEHRAEWQLLRKLIPLEEHDQD